MSNSFSHLYQKDGKGTIVKILVLLAIQNECDFMHFCTQFDLTQETSISIPIKCVCRVIEYNQS